jgi:hypothetical protein
MYLNSAVEAADRPFMPFDKALLSVAEGLESLVEVGDINFELLNCGFRFIDS